MNIIEQPVLIAATSADNSVGLGIMLVMFATIITSAALRSLSKRTRGQWLTLGRSRGAVAANQLADHAVPCTGCPGN